MSRNKTTKRPPSPPSIDRPGNDLPVEVTDPQAAQTAREKHAAREEAEIFHTFGRELGNEGTVALHRSHPNMPSNNGKPGYVGTVSRNDFTLERITEMFGGGDYVGRAKVEGSRFNGEERRFTIDHAIPPKNPKGPAQEKAAAAPALDIPGIMREMREMIRDSVPKENSSGLVDIVKAALARPEPKGEIAALAELIKEGREEARRSEDRFMKLFEKLNERNAPAEAPRTLREQLEEAKELIDMIGGGGEKEGGDWKAELFKFAKEAVPVVVARLQIAGAGQPGGFPPNAMQPATVLPAPALVSGASSALPAAAPVSAPGAGAGVAHPGQVTDPAADPNSDMLIQIALRQFCTSAVAAARKNKDPYEFICSTLDFVPADYHGKIFEAARSPDWFTIIFAGDAEAMRHMKFLTELREALFARALVSHAIRFKTVNKDFKETALQFAGWLPEDAKGAIWEWCEGENWKMLFDGVELENVALASSVWLEDLRLELDRLLGLEDPAPAPAAAVEIVSQVPGKAAGGKPKVARKTA